MVKKKETDNEVLKKILARLNSIDPPVSKIAVNSPDPAMTMYFLDLEDVCYITSKSESGRAEVMYVTKEGEQYYNNMSLANLEKKLAEHPHFLRTSKSYIVNLTRITGFRFSAARDLWFEGYPDPVINCVTASYLEEFEKHFK